MSLLSHLDIVNAACAEIGEEPLQSLDEEIDAGQSASLLYDATLEFNIDVGKFAFAKQLRQLSIDALSVPLSGFSKVYDLPAERIGDPIYVTDDIASPDRRFSRYAIVGPKLQADAGPLFAMILFKPEPYSWSGAFKSVMITSLAAKFAISLAHDRALSEDMRSRAYGPPSENFRGGLMRAALSAAAFTAPPRNQNRDDNPLSRAWRS